MGVLPSAALLVLIPIVRTLQFFFTLRPPLCRHCPSRADFAGFQVPTTIEEVVDDVQMVKVNTFSSQQVIELTKVDSKVIADNPIIYGLVFAMTGACAVSVAFFCWRDDCETKERALRVRPQSSLLRIKSLTSFTSATAGGADASALCEGGFAEAQGTLRELAASEIQRHSRGMLARRLFRMISAVGQNSRVIVKRTWRQIMVGVGERLRSDHSVLGAL